MIGLTARQVRDGVAEGRMSATEVCAIAWIGSRASTPR